MLQTRTLAAPIRLEIDDIQAVLSGLRSCDWVPVISEVDGQLLRMFGLPRDVVARAPVARASRLRSGFIGDLFLKGGDVYYCLSPVRERLVAQTEGRLKVELGVPDNARLEVSVLSAESDGMNQRLSDFASAVRQAILKSLDGRRTRHMDFNWAPLQFGAGLQPLLNPDDETADIRFEVATLTPQSIMAAEALTVPLARELVQELSAAGFARERDIMASRRSRRGQEAKTTLRSLQESGCVKTEYLLECRKNNTPLTRLANKEELQKDEIAKLRCGTCNATFEQELLSEGYSLSDLGRRLIQKSHWMTEWVTSKLNEIGIPQESILWSVTQSGEEIDIVARVLDQLWIFELKDREFGSGDAHPFNYRKVRYEADKAIIVTTDKVSKDAKRVFSELAATGEGDARQPVYVEGLAHLMTVLQTELSAAALDRFCGRLQSLADRTGYDLARLIALRVAQPTTAE